VGDQPQQSNFINVSDLKLDGSGRPIEVVTLEVSISRTIAFVGAGSMLIVYLGFGVLSVYHFGRTCSLPPGTAQATGFIWTGIAFFVPYIANKIFLFCGGILDLISRRGYEYNSIADSRGISRDDFIQNLRVSDRQPTQASPQDLPQTSAQLNSDIHIDKFSEKNSTFAPKSTPQSSDSKDISGVSLSEIPNIEMLSLDITRRQMPKTEMPHLDSSHLEIPNIEMPDLDISHPEMPSIKAPRIDTSDSGMPAIEMPHLDISHTEMLKIEMPYLDISHLEALQPEMSQISAVTNPDSTAAITSVVTAVEIAESESVAINESSISGSNRLNEFTYSKAFLLISEFEGFFGQASLINEAGLEGYVVGYGFTSVQGRNVTQADTMTQEQADLLLEQGVESYAKYLGPRIPFWLEMTLNQQCALIAFAWNMGASFFEAPGFDVISSYLKLRDWQSVTSAICLYNNYGADPIPSLRGRRQAESNLWQAGLVELNNNVSADPVTSSPPLSPAPLNGVAAVNEEISANEENNANEEISINEEISTNGANGANRANGVNEINRPTFDQVPSGLDASSLPPVDLNFLANSELKIAIIDKLEPGDASESMEISADISPETPPEVSIGERQKKLVVGHFDNLLINSAQDYKDSFSNCCAMLAGFWRRIEGADEYNARRESFGSSAIIKSQQDALGYFGLVSEFIDDATVDLIKSEIDAGRPVAVCWLCYGPFGQPAGGGHWTLVTGYDDNGFFVNDPFGQCDLENGGYSELGNGSDNHYGFEHWLPRWTLGGGVGLALTCHSLA
jgi:GH24 family phage-related lysozyme (muramidase)